MCRDVELMKFEPWRFYENNPKYYICCGLAHVKYVTLIFTAIKTLFVIWYVSWQIVMAKDIAIIFGMSMLLASYAFLAIGVINRKYTFLTPYFTLCVLLILILIMKLFVEVLNTASNNYKLENVQLATIIGQSLMIMIEIYSVYAVWKVFSYITDYYMEEEFRIAQSISEKRKEQEILEETLKKRRLERQALREANDEEAKKMRRPSIFQPLIPKVSSNLLPVMQKYSVEQQIHKLSQNSTTTSSDRS